MALSADQCLAYPNPLKGSTLWFAYACRPPARVTIDIMNVAGEKIVTLRDAPTAEGMARTPWETNRLAPGIYLFRARVEDTDGVRDFGWQKFVVVR
jgi:hypothetical protein